MRYRVFCLNHGRRSRLYLKFPSATVDWVYGKTIFRKGKKKSFLYCVQICSSKKADWKFLRKKNESKPLIDRCQVFAKVLKGERIPQRFCLISSHRTRKEQYSQYPFQKKGKITYCYLGMLNCAQKSGPKLIIPQKTSKTSS